FFANRSVELIVIGRPEQKDYVTMLKKRSQGLVNVTLIPKDPAAHKWDYYDRADIFAMPSHNELFGLTLLEAAVRWNSIIATRSPGPSYILNGNGQPGYGWLVDDKIGSSSVRVFSETLLKLIHVHQTAQERQRKQAMINRLKQNFVWPVVADSFASLVRNNHPRGSQHSAAN
ncbi:glycosyltransferase, partial [Candidatus Berkelbacteria bacterium]|nr:glycosyltransferase [Candidatus Berkelbacteria bacterium]